MGAYEFLLKPVGPGEIISQVDDVLRQRREEAEPPAEEQLRKPFRDLTAEDCLPVQEDEQEHIIYAGSLMLDLPHQQVHLSERIINLPPCTFEYLVTLARHAPKAVNYQTLVGESQGYWLTPLEAQDLARWRIYRLRNALEEDPGEPRYVLTEPGTGYRLMVR
jgi:two-component system KDP operon response regulator KdpE